MAIKNIKTGDLVVSEFIEELTSENVTDSATLEIIKQLYSEDRLTTTKLEQALTQHSGSTLETRLSHAEGQASED